MSFYLYSTSIIDNFSISFYWALLSVSQLCVNTIYIDFSTATSSISEAPVSKTALVGTNAQFHCVGTGNNLLWEVDGLASDHVNILARKIMVATNTSSGTVQSSLTVPATSENNGTTVRCAISVSLFSTPAISNYCSLTVLPGELVGWYVVDTGSCLALSLNCQEAIFIAMNVYS